MDMGDKCPAGCILRAKQRDGLAVEPIAGAAPLCFAERLCKVARFVWRVNLHGLGEVWVCREHGFRLLLTGQKFVRL